VALSPTSSRSSSSGGGVTVVEVVTFTATVSIAGTAEATPTNVVSLAAHTLTSSVVYCLELFAASVAPGPTTGSRIDVIYRDGTTSQGIVARYEQNSASTVRFGALYARVYITGDGASHTYVFAAYRLISDGSIAAGAGGSGALLPGYIRLSSGS
jgi:hypothetical protein